MSKPSLEWIRLELIPLPESDLTEKLLFWNPQTQEILGEGAEEVLALVEKATQEGGVHGQTLTHFEITDPLSKPSELAAILSQYFWVVPEPVADPAIASQEASLTPQ